MMQSRRHFLGTIPGGLAGATTLDSLSAKETAWPLKGRLYKTLKVKIIREGKTMSEKFAIAKAAGFEGIEMHAPRFDIDEVKRVIKLDVKGFSREKDQFEKIGEGDLDFEDVRKALTEINYHGWCAAEVKGGDATQVREISENMGRVFCL